MGATLPWPAPRGRSGEDVFVHFSAVAGQGFTSLAEGDQAPLAAMR